MRYVLGVDIGTTSTAAATLGNGPPEALPLGGRGSAVPTVVLLRPDGTVLVGEAAERRAFEFPDRVAHEFKRRVGDSVPLLLGGAPHSAQSLMALVLRWVLDRAGELRGAAPERVLVSHPANWGPYKREVLVGAFTAAGLPPVTLLTEPEAAALHFAAAERIDLGQTVAVYDLGGGTFDAALLRRTAEGFEPVGAPEGIESLGGMDFDEAVLGHVRRALGAHAGDLDGTEPSVQLALRRDLTEAKEALSEDVDAVVAMHLRGESYDVLIRRSEFEEMIRPALELTVDCLERTLTRAGLAPDDVAAVVLSGGSSRIPLVRELLASRMGRPVVVDHHPQLAVALGAVRHGSVGAASSAGTATRVVMPGAVRSALVSDPTVEPAGPAAATAATDPGAGNGVRPRRPHGPVSRPVLMALSAALLIGVGVGSLALVANGSDPILTTSAGRARASAAAARRRPPRQRRRRARHPWRSGWRRPRTAGWRAPTAGSPAGAAGAPSARCCSRSGPASRCARTRGRVGRHCGRVRVGVP